VKQGGDFCKDLGAILNERSEAELQYAKALTKLSAKLLKAVPPAPSSGNRGGDAAASSTVAAAWHSAAKDMDAAAELHRTFGHSLSDDVVKPLRALHEKQHRIRKSVEASVDKTGRALADWRQAEAKAKKTAFAAARDQERVWASAPAAPAAGATPNGTLEANGAAAAGAAKRRRKVEDAAKRADVEYYSFCLRAERARLDWEAAVARGARCLQILDEERLQELSNLAARYVRHLREVGPGLTASADRLAGPVAAADPAGDAAAAAAATQLASAPAPEQLLPDFYAEHVTLAMNRERRRQALLKVLQLLKQDLERERRSKQGVEMLARAILAGGSPPTGTTNEDDARRNAVDKLHHMRSMLTYLEAARYKIQGALADLEGRPRANHPLAEHILVQRDRHGLQRSILRVPAWARDDALTLSADWADRGAADGTSAQPESDPDEFSDSDSESRQRESAATPGAQSRSPSQRDTLGSNPNVRGTCRALYQYDANLYDELNINPGEYRTY